MKLLKNNIARYTMLCMISTTNIPIMAMMALQTKQKQVADETLKTAKAIDPEAIKDADKIFKEIDSLKKWIGYANYATNILDLNFMFTWGENKRNISNSIERFKTKYKDKEPTTKYFFPKLENSFASIDAFVATKTPIPDEDQAVKDYMPTFKLLGGIVSDPWWILGKTILKHIENCDKELRDIKKDTHLKEEVANARTSFYTHVKKELVDTFYDKYNNRKHNNEKWVYTGKDPDKPDDTTILPAFEKLKIETGS